MQQIGTEEYKTRHDWVGKAIHRELCKKLKITHTNKWYMHNPASVQENQTHKLPWNLMYKQITKSRLDDQTL